jgi:hypothetical protein
MSGERHPAPAPEAEAPPPLPADARLPLPAAAPAPAHQGLGRGLVLPAVLALVLSAALLFAQRRLDFNLNEEGFLWYGAVAAAHGDVPLRDFYSYDPGRYYWAAAWTPLVGEGLLGLRLATAAFGALGLWCGLLAARRVIANPWLLTAAGIVLTAWLLPRNKLYEPAITMAAVLAATCLVERPDRRRHLLAGAMVGFGTFMGKNHGLYLGVAFLALILLLWLRRAGPEAPERPGLADETAQPDEPRDPHRPGEVTLPDAAAEPRQLKELGQVHGRHVQRRDLTSRLRELGRRLGAFAGGIGLGALPLLAMLALVPGFARAWLDSIRFFVEQGQTNFPRPVPWPWNYAYGAMAPWDAATTFAIGFGFLLTVAFFALAVPAVALMPWPRLRRNALLAAAAAVGAVYTHHAFSRADLAHLAPSIHPLLLGLLAVPAAGAAALAARPAAARAARWAAGAAVGLLLAFETAAAAVPSQPLYHQLTTGIMEPYTIAGEELRLRPRTIALLDWVERSVAARIPPRAPILLAPNLPGLYPVLGRRSPVWDVYPIWPASDELDRRMLAELERHHVEWAFVQKASVDGRTALQFRRTHPRVWDYLMANFELEDSCRPERPMECALLHKKTPETGKRQEDRP